MRTPKHTPGPWVINAHDTGMNDSGTIEGNGIVICPEVYGESKARCDANAHLIAAAPARLEALRLAEHNLTEIENYIGGDAVPAGLLDTVRAAIAQAEGRTL